MMQKIHPTDASGDEFFFTLSEQGIPVVCRIHQWISSEDGATPLSMVRDEPSGLSRDGKHPVCFPLFVAQVPAMNFSLGFDVPMN